MARVTTSPHVTGSYVIQYRPGIPSKDYIVAFQCGHVLRLLSLPAPARSQFVALDGAFNWGTNLLRAFYRESEGSSPPPESSLRIFADQLVSGLLTQLRSIPIGMRIDAWLGADYPGLAEEQAESLAAQQQEALSCLSPRVRSMVPDEIVSAGILLNATYALFCDRLLGITRYQIPYAASGFADLSRGLLKIFDNLPADPASDRTLVDVWAREIGLSGTYAWVPLPPPAPKAS